MHLGRKLKPLQHHGGTQVTLLRLNLAHFTLNVFQYPQVFSHAFVFLRKESDFHGIPYLDLTLIGLKPPRDQIEQGGLAGSVRSDNPDAIIPENAQLQVFKEIAPPESF